MIVVRAYRAEGYPLLVLVLDDALAPPPTVDLFDPATDERVTYVVDPDA